MQTFLCKGQFTSEEYTLFFSKENTSTWHILNNHISLKQNQALILPPHTVCTYRGEKAFSCYQISFSKEAFYQACLPVIEGCPLLYNFFIHDDEHDNIPFLHFSDIHPNMLLAVSQMKHEYERHEAYYGMLLLCSLMKLLLQMNRSCRVTATISDPLDSQIYQRIFAYITEHSASTSLEDVASAFNYHPNTISTIIKKNAGQTFLELRTKIRLGHAAHLLLQKDINTHQAAQICGYSNMSNFYSQFKKQYGVTPGEYAQSVSN